MKEEFSKILQEVRNTDNPAVKAITLSFYLSTMLKEDRINIYEAYLLQMEIINYRREGYTLPAWNDKVQMTNCIEILNQRLLAIVFKDDKYADYLKTIGMEAFHLCRTKWSNYIMNNYAEYLNSDENSIDLLQKLYDIRVDYDSLCEDGDCYHVEEFPFHYYEPEKMLLDKIDLQNMKSISDEIETLLIELNSQ